MEYLHGGDVYTFPEMLDFSANINPLGASDSVLAAAAKAVSKMARYPDFRCRRLREVLAGKLTINPEYLIFGNGAAELIFLLSLAERPRKAVILAPSFAEYKQALAAVNCEVCLYQLQEADGFQLTETYLDYLTPDVDMIFLCSPNNPVGNVIDHELLLEIVKHCRQNQIRMVMDECFNEFLDTWQQETLLLQTEEYPQLFILQAFTKMYAMAGLRLGYGVCSDLALMERLNQMRQPWSVSVVAQAAGVAAVADADWPSKTRQYINKERKWLVGELQAIGICCYPSSANYIFMKSEFDLYEELLRRQILIRDCSNYDGLTKGYYRIAVRLQAENRKLVAALTEICGGLLRRDQGLWQNQL